MENKPSRSFSRWRRKSTPYLMLAPIMAFLVAFMFGPILYALWMSFWRWSLVGGGIRFLGLTNYINAISQPRFIRSLTNSTYYVLATVVFAIPISLFIAVALNGIISRRLRTVFTALYFLPIVTSMVAASIVWRHMYHPGAGVINFFLGKLGIPAQGWTADPGQAMLAIVIMAIWKNLGFSVVIFLAALQGIPSIFYEAARIDGASKWAIFRRITFPLLQPASLFILVTSVIWGFQIFAPVMLMTEGGPGDSSYVLGYYIYQEAFAFDRMGYAAALAFSMFVILIVVTIVQLRGLAKKWQY